MITNNTVDGIANYYGRPLIFNITNMQIQKITVKTPRLVQIAFLALLLLPVLFFWIGRASAKEINCKAEYYQNFFTTPPVYLQNVCGKKWDYYSRLEIQLMNRYFSNH